MSLLISYLLKELHVELALVDDFSPKSLFDGIVLSDVHQFLGGFVHVTLAQLKQAFE